MVTTFPLLLGQLQFGSKVSFLLTYISIRALTVPELTQQMFDAKNMMAACDPRY